MARGDQEAAVENVAEMNEAIVGDGFHPLQWETAAGVVEEDARMVEVALELLVTVIAMRRQSTKYTGRVGR